MLLIRFKNVYFGEMPGNVYISSLFTECVYLWEEPDPQVQPRPGPAHRRYDITDLIPRAVLPPCACAVTSRLHSSTPARFLGGPLRTLCNCLALCCIPATKIKLSINCNCKTPHNATGGLYSWRIEVSGGKRNTDENT